MPDVLPSGEEKIDAVVLDDDAVGAPDGNGDGAKILRGDGALDVYLGNSKRPSKVRAVAGFDGRRAAMIVSLKLHDHKLGVFRPLICRRQLKLLSTFMIIHERQSQYNLINY